MGQNDVKRYAQVNGNVKRQAAASTQATSSEQCNWRWPYTPLFLRDSVQLLDDVRVYGANGHLFGDFQLISLLFQPSALASPTLIDSGLIIANSQRSVDYIRPANINQA